MTTNKLQAVRAAAAESIAKQAAAAYDTRWIVAPTEWYRDAPPARRWLLRDSRRDKCPGVFPLGKAGQLVAAGGVGKTMALVSLAYSVATGRRWLGTFDCTEPGPVLMLLGEEDAEEAHRRIYNDARGLPVPPAGSIVVVTLAGVTCAMLESDANGNPSETAFAAWLRAKVATRDDWRLIVIDPQSRFAGLDAETDNAIATRFVQVAESFATPTRSVLVSHHTPQTSRGKGAVEEPRGRGVTALHDGFRWQASLTSETLPVEDPIDRERLGEIVTLKNTKNNYAKKAEPIQLRRDDHGALVPLDDDDEELVRGARAGAGQRRARTDEREAERDRVQTQRAKAEAERRAAARAKREAERRERDQADDDTVRAILEREPGIGARDLRATVKAALACGTERADDAIRRVRPLREVT